MPNTVIPGTWKVEVDPKKLREAVCARPDGVSPDDFENPLLYVLTLLKRDYGIQVNTTHFGLAKEV